MRNGAKPKVLVLGGGFGGLESAFYLRHKLGDRADITLVSDRDYFLYKPNTIYIPFGQDPEKLKIPLAKPTSRKHIAFEQAHVREIDPISHTVAVDGKALPYDFLVVATGATMRPDEVSGLAKYANTIWTPEEMLRLRQGVTRVVEEARQGRHRRVLFLVPPNNKCSGPLYEMVMMLDTWLRRKGVRDHVHVTWTTYESGFIQAFGPRLHEVTHGEFEKRNIEHHTDYVVDRVEKDEVLYQNGESLPYDLLISFPPYIASTRFTTLPSDDRGFIAADLSTRQVKGHDNIYVAGDAGDFPVKQAFLAFLQADAVADQISARILGTAPKVTFEPVSMCVMEQFNQATFAQVPLRLTGRPEKPIEVRTEETDLYKVGTSALWRPGKKLLAYYLPWRFRSGEPFHAGLPWQGMDAGLKVMSKVLAK